MNVFQDMALTKRPGADILVATAGNDVPARARAEYLVARRGGKRLRYALFPAGGRPRRGTVVILQGRNECIEKYYETIGDLSRRGLGVAIMDWRGQGGSDRLLRDREKGFVRSYDDYVADLDQFFEDVILPDCVPECLNQKAQGRGEKSDFENRSAAYIRVREHRKRRNCDLQPGMATFGSDTQDAVVGEFGADQLADDALGFAIGLRHRIEPDRIFVRHRARRAKARQGLARRRRRHAPHELSHCHVIDTRPVVKPSHGPNSRAASSP
jgi:hypothetical protein